MTAREGRTTWRVQLRDRAALNRICQPIAQAILLALGMMGGALPPAVWAATATVPNGGSLKQTTSTDLTLDVTTTGHTAGSISLAGVGSAGTSGSGSYSISYTCQNTSDGSSGTIGSAGGSTTTDCTTTTDSQTNIVNSCTAASGFTCIENVTGGTFTNACVDSSGNSVPGGCTLSNNNTQCTVTNGSYCGVVGYNTAGDSGTSGSNVTANVTATGTTISGDAPPYSFGIGVTSQGNTGGNGSSDYGGNGGNGTNGGNATAVLNSGAVSTTDYQSFGLGAFSIGGNGGNGGNCNGFGCTAGNGGNGGNAGTAMASFNDGTITTSGDSSPGIMVESVGGGGGSGGELISNGFPVTGSSGSGGIAGAGGEVDVSTAFGTSISTTGNYSHGILAQSIGGNGGGGGAGFSYQSWWYLNPGSVSGSGGAAADAGAVTVNSQSIITTSGNYSNGILAQSIGGGGGSAGIQQGFAFGSSSTGGNGGNGGTVEVYNAGQILTTGILSEGILAQSIGGGGGNGGNSSGGITMGGNGGTSGDVTVGSLNGVGGNISTYGDLSAGIIAQSIGGGGGNGGNSGGSYAMGGSGGTGGKVTVGQNINGIGGNISTFGDLSAGILAQSIGGGGGNGGNSNGSYAMGGSGGTGSTIAVYNADQILTAGILSEGILAQSIGGGGGNGGNSSGSYAIGGSGGTGAIGGAVTVNNTGVIATLGIQSAGIIAQSVGGGGGNGGSASGGYAIGGSGGTGANGGAVTVNFYNKDGHILDHRDIEAAANRVNISLRTGCFCNPGAGEIALGISRLELDVCFTQPGHKQRLSVDDFRLCIDGKASGAVRISVGLVTNFNDVQAFLRFARGLLQ